MSLTVSQMDEVRHYAGYPATGTITPINADSDLVYINVGMQQVSLYEWLTTLTPNQVIITQSYLNVIEGLRTAIAASSTNLDTDRAAVFYHNKNEVRDRTRLYHDECRRMCGFLGIPPGPALGQGGVSSISRG